MNGLYESLYHGVPLLAFPMFGDQPHNAVMIEEKGYGLQLSLKDFTVDELLEKIDTILGDDKYRYYYCKD